MGSHTKDYNSISYGISFMGNYNFSVPGGDAISGKYHFLMYAETRA